MAKQKKVALLNRLIGEGWFADRREAEVWVMTRKVLVNDQPAMSVMEKVLPSDIIRVKEHYKTKYVGKGGLKLEGALHDFGVDVRDLVALDCGASTGGFTDCLVSQGASLVYAVDVGFGQLAGKLAQSARVVNMEKTNLSDERLLSLSPRPSLITLDLSYLSLKAAVPICQKILHGRGAIIALIKPLFEVSAPEVRREGKIDNPQMLRDILRDICAHFSASEMDILGLTNSPVTGNHNTLEYFIHLSCGVEVGERLNGRFEGALEAALERSLQLEKFDKNSAEV